MRRFLHPSAASRVMASSVDGSSHFTGPAFDWKAR